MILGIQSVRCASAGLRSKVIDPKNFRSQKNFDARESFKKYIYK